MTMFIELPEHYRLSCLKKTADNWCPNIDKQYVRVSVLACKVSGVFDRVCVWGGDDFGMELDGPDAMSVFLQLMTKEYINMSDLKQLGFVHA